MVVVLKAPTSEELILENVDGDGNPVPFPSPPFRLQVVDRNGREVLAKESGIFLEGQGNSIMRILFSSEETRTLAQKRQPLSFSLYKVSGGENLLLASGVLLSYLHIFPQEGS